MEGVNKALGILTLIAVVSCNAKQKSLQKIDNELSSTQLRLTQQKVKSSSLSTTLVNDSLVKTQRMIIFPQGRFKLTKSGYEGQAHKIEIETSATHFQRQQTAILAQAQHTKEALSNATVTSQQHSTTKIKNKASINILGVISIVLCLTAFIWYRLHKSTR